VAPSQLLCPTDPDIALEPGIVKVNVEAEIDAVSALSVVTHVEPLIAVAALIRTRLTSGTSYNTFVPTLNKFGQLRAERDYGAHRRVTHRMSYLPDSPPNQY
jgi:hypothetical protein